VKASNRRSQITELLRNRPVEVDELAARFGVSASTIRRDLARLTEGGEIVRTYGGAVTGARGEQTLHERELLARPEKAAIARHAEQFVPDDSLVLLDAGTTTGALATRLADRQGLTVATNGLTALNALAEAQGVRLIVLGGTLRHVSLGMVGSIAETALSALTADAAFLGADGVVAGRGMCEATEEQAALKRLMVAQAGAVYVLADASKLGAAPSHFWTRPTRPWTLVTDAGATEEQLAPFHADPLITVCVAGR
jgi:DeoR/GlpR family transcriptional regulator of sugar metabolism